MEPWETRIVELLKTNLELKDKLIEALETDHFFITISCEKRKSPDDPHDLKHYWKVEKYPKDDVLNTLRHLIRDYAAKEQPLADLGEDGELH